MDRFSRAAALVVAAVGVSVLIGWIFDLPALKSVIPGLATMKVNAACAFLVAGTSLWLSLAAGGRARTAGTGLAFFASAVGGLTLAEYLFAFDLGIDQLLLRAGLEDPAVASPGRMAPATALSFLFLGMALVTLRAGRPRNFVARSYWLVLPALLLSAIALVGYVFDVHSLYKVGPYAPMAAHTAGAFFLLALAILAANREGGIARIFVGESAGGIIVRRLLPTLPVAFLVLGWLRLQGQNAGLFDTQFGVALTVVLSVAISTFAVYSTAMRLHAVDLERELAQAQLLAMHDDLERRVLERTQELENSLAQVKQLSGLLPICAWCKKVRDDQDYWQSVEQFVTARSEARFTHGICPECSARM